ncbi:tetratricopeptide repeat protein [Streptomyces yaizuensis]|uniref:Tetratricopeptide repeat protein n=1 Tax=Streptomyces yaizuensis TaxID=2989713 RepID=A0ABQ5P4F4_9ACTN|nr:tetratricopeptide repeat protein [Streptomyces sp. YSPA8]GLF97481.1 tetratricopeptide repeat protein [Streptomyces sp. YSPA8]
MATREPNTRLALLHREAGWTNSQFVMAVNRIGTERGTPTRYQHPSVSQWIGGLLPKKETRPLILEALTRRLKRPITADNAGFPPTVDADSPGITAGIIDLGSKDMLPSRRGITNATLFSVALTIPNWQEIVGRMEKTQQGSTVRIGQSDVDSVIAMTERFSELDDQFGGRYARPSAAAFLVNIVAPYLRADAPDAVRRSMMAAASDLCYLTGYMAVDEGLEGLAQQYYLRALELAGASGDHLTYCTTLRGMSVQAVGLGHGGTALRLADAAAAASPQAGPRMRAFLAGQQAHAAAQCGDSVTALQYLKEAEVAMDKAESREKTFGSYDPSALYYHIGHVRHQLGDLPGAIEAMGESGRLCYEMRRRSRIRHRATLAQFQIQNGHLEQACATWGLVLDEYPLVQSGRVDRQVKQMISAIGQHGRNPYARSLYERARSLIPASLNS